MKSDEKVLCSVGFLGRQFKSDETGHVEMGWAEVTQCRREMIRD